MKPGAVGSSTTYEPVVVAASGAKVSPVALEEVQYGEGGFKGWLMFLLVASAMFLMNGSYSIVMTVMPDIADDLNTDISSVVWVSLATILGSTGAMPAAGMLGDTLGHGVVWHAGMAVRIATQIFAGLAPNLPCLLVSRALNGLGGALDGPTGTALVMRAFPATRRPFFLGLMTAVGSASQTFGLLLGAIIANACGWRWLFLGPVPLLFVIQVAMAALMWRPHLLGFQKEHDVPGSSQLKSSDDEDDDGTDATRFKEDAGNSGQRTELSFSEAPASLPPEERRAAIVAQLRSFDWRGSFLLTATTASLLLLINRAPVANMERRRSYANDDDDDDDNNNNHGGYGATISVVVSGLAFVPLASLLWHREKRHPRPVLPAALLDPTRNPTFVAALLGNVLLWTPYFAAWLLLPLLLRDFCRFSPLRTATWLLARPMFNASVGALSGHFLERGKQVQRRRKLEQHSEQQQQRPSRVGEVHGDDRGDGGEEEVEAAPGGYRRQEERCGCRWTTWSTLVVGASLELPSYVWMRRVVQWIGAVGPTSNGTTGASSVDWSLFWSMQGMLAVQGTGLGMAYNGISLFVADQASENRLGNALGLVRMGQQLAAMLGQTMVAAILDENDSDFRRPRIGPYETSATATVWLSVLFSALPVWLSGHATGRRQQQDEGSSPEQQQEWEMEFKTKHGGGNSDDEESNFVESDVVQQTTITVLHSNKKEGPGLE